MDFQTLIKRIIIQLGCPLPGEKAHALMWPSTRFIEDFPHVPENATPAAVLILLYPEHNKIHFFLTERSQNVAKHKGQISLPGGVREAGEKLQETAVRETEEEIAVKRENIKIMGCLTPFFVPVTGFIVHPFIGYCGKKPTAKALNNEVNALFAVTLDQLLDENLFKKEKRILRNINAEVPFFYLNSHKVWGVTGAILSEFKFILKKSINV